MTDLDARIRDYLAEADGETRSTDPLANALRAVLDIHCVDTFWSRPGRPESCEGCGVEDAICGDPTLWPCDTVKAIASTLGVSE